MVGGEECVACTENIIESRVVHAAVGAQNERKLLHRHGRQRDFNETAYRRPRRERVERGMNDPCRCARVRVLLLKRTNAQ